MQITYIQKRRRDGSLGGYRYLIDGVKGRESNRLYAYAVVLRDDGRWRIGSMSSTLSGANSLAKEHIKYRGYGRDVLDTDILVLPVKENQPS